MRFHKYRNVHALKIGDLDYKLDKAIFLMEFLTAKNAYEMFSSK